MKLQGKQKLILTKKEKETLKQASTILKDIAELMDRAISVPWSYFDDDEILGACDIIDSFCEEE